MYCWNFKHNGSESLRIGLKIWNSDSDPKIYVAEPKILIF